MAITLIFLGVLISVTIAVTALGGLIYLFIYVAEEYEDTVALILLILLIVVLTIFITIDVNEFM